MSSDLREFIMLLQSCQQISRPLAKSIFRDGQMFGRHVEKERIINFLLHTRGGSTGEVEVLPIIGDDGTGKATLVQHACDDARVRRHFAVIMLCCTYTITADRGTPVLRSKRSIGDGGINLNDPMQLFKGQLWDKKFLMVFEDVDMKKMQMLEGLLPSMGCSKEGSKVIITTNNRHVGALGTVDPITLKVFPFPEYWFFFKAHAFAGRDVEENLRLVSAGKSIAMKLNGSFFGAKIVGAVLRDQSDPKLWDMVLRDVAGLSLLGDAIAHVWDLADNLLPG
ncbi:hypothetical protein PR202_gb00033 [Eleusine coracana subsp. coracana]|uniref:NB-ARC domain-containing protein n=1 Tax=Eleusine coracana subsp. coracana TaxID=191504 RepID=A0AAV5DSD9_ELECO|nr:hypothetical protein QOZ80_5BG0435890 [Eleusine coracana subsp. coracana]GJN13340.1 hypothetical protein PR202_gb00033 [Eleusine coracana subsp. coracana]